MRIATGLTNTMVNNALQLANPKVTVLPPVPQPTPRDPQANEAIYQANQAVLAGINQVTPRGVPQVPKPVPPVSDKPLVYKRGVEPISPETVAIQLGIGQKAGKVASAAGFNITIPKKEDTLDTYLADQLNKANTALTNLTTDNTKLLTARKDIQDEINKIVNANSTEELQQSMIDLIDKSRDIKQKVTTTRDFFIEKDANGKERLSKRGTAILALTMLSQFFGNPAQVGQTSAMAVALGDRYANEQNRLNENLFKNQLDDFNKKIQSYQAQIGLKSQKMQRELTPKQSELGLIDKQLAQNFELSKDQRKAINDTVKEISLAKIKAGSAEDKALAAEAWKMVYSGDPYLEALGYATLKSLGYSVEAPSGPSVRAQERGVAIDYKKAAVEDLKDKKNRDAAELELKKRGVKVSEDRLIEQVAHNRVMEDVAKFNAQKPRGGSGGGGIMNWLMKNQLDNNVSINTKSINDLNKDLDKDVRDYNKALQTADRMKNDRGANGKLIYTQDDINAQLNLASSIKTRIEDNVNTAKWNASRIGDYNTQTGGAFGYTIPPINAAALRIVSPPMREIKVPPAAGKSEGKGKFK